MDNAEIARRLGYVWCELGKVWHKPGHLPEHEAIPNFTTDIAAAWLLVEFMRERGWQSYHGETDGIYRFGFRKGTLAGSGESEIMCQAICRAFMAATGGDDVAA